MESTKEKQLQDSLLSEKVTRLREQGLDFRLVGAMLNISHSKAFRVYHGKRTLSMDSRVVNAKRVIEMRQNGSSVTDIANKFKVSTSTISNICKGIGKRTTNEPIIRSLSAQGLTRMEIVHKTGLNYRTVARYTNRDPNKPKTVKMPKKKEIKAVQPMVDRYANLQKGLEKGVKEVVTSVRADRDQGVTNSFRYKDDFSSKPITIYVKDGLGREESALRWCEKNGKTFVNLI